MSIDWCRPCRRSERWSAAKELSTGNRYFWSTPVNTPGQHGLLDCIEEILKANGVAPVVTGPSLTTVAQAQDLRAQARAERRRVICRKKAQHALVNGIRSMRKRHDERGKYFGGPAGEAGYCLGDIGVGFEGIHGARYTPR